MKSASPALVAFLNAARANPDAPIAFADCFTFTLATGTILAYANVDQPVVYNGLTFRADGPLVQGLKYKASVGLEVDKQQITIAARPTDLVAGSPFLNALRDGAFDGAIVQRDRVFMSALGQAPIGGVTLFHGRVSTVDQVGRTSATITVASDLVVLDYDMPRNLYSPTCLHTLYDAGCGVISRGTYAASGDGRRRLDREPHQFLRRAGDPRAGLARLRVGRQRQSARDGEERRRRRLAQPDVSAALAAGDRRRLHRLRRLRPHAGDLFVALRQPRHLPRLPLRAAAADRLLSGPQFPSWSAKERSTSADTMSDANALPSTTPIGASAATSRSIHPRMEMCDAFRAIAQAMGRAQFARAAACCADLRRRLAGPWRRDKARLGEARRSPAGDRRRPRQRAALRRLPTAARTPRAPLYRASNRQARRRR